MVYIFCDGEGDIPESSKGLGMGFGLATGSRTLGGSGTLGGSTSGAVKKTVMASGEHKAACEQ
jgi:hypothetical protein